MRLATPSLDLQGLKVLIIDDNPGDARLVEEYLIEGAPGQRMSIDQAVSTREAHACLDRQVYDILMREEPDLDELR